MPVQVGRGWLACATVAVPTVANAPRRWRRIPRPVAAAGEQRGRAGSRSHGSGIPTGAFIMGTVDQLVYPGDGEGPLRPVALYSYAIDCCTVSNEQFRAFVEDCGYRTESERLGWSFVLAGLLPDDSRLPAPPPLVATVAGTSWRNPEGPRSDVAARLDHPVVYVSWNDASAYAVLGRQDLADGSVMGMRRSRWIGIAAVSLG